MEMVSDVVVWQDIYLAKSEGEKDMFCSRSKICAGNVLSTTQRLQNMRWTHHQPTMSSYSSQLCCTKIPQKDESSHGNNSRRTIGTGIPGGDEGDEGGPAGLLGGGEGLLDPAAHPPPHGCYVWTHDCCCS